MSKDFLESEQIGIVSSEITSGLNIKIQKHHLSSQDINEFIEYNGLKNLDRKYGGFVSQ